MTTLRDFLPPEAHYTHEALLSKHGDKRVVKRFDGAEIAFPDLNGKYRHVMHWVLLEDGSAVGWNESPRSGWGFPRLGKRAVINYHRRASNPWFDPVNGDA